MSLLHTPLYDEHVALGGEMAAFCGYEVPAQYAGALEEHAAVRERAGLFDVSYMGRIRIVGPNAQAFVQMVTTNDISEMQDGACKYSLICNEDGGVMDDIYIDKEHVGRYFLVINPVNLHKVLDHLQANLPPGVQIRDLTSRTAQLAIQGPAAHAVMQSLGAELPQEADTFVYTTLLGAPCHLSRTGYTGEDGYEICCRADDAPQLWRELLQRGAAHGLVPCGFKARESLRFEASLPLYGHELNEDITPFEAGLGMYVRPLQGRFIGSDALNKHVYEGVMRKRIGLRIVGDSLPQTGCVVYADDVPCGMVTSAGRCPTLQENCAMALVNVAFLERDVQQFAIQTDGGRVPCEQVPLPFYRRA